MADKLSFFISFQFSNKNIVCVAISLIHKKNVTKIIHYLMSKRILVISVQFSFADKKCQLPIISNILAVNASNTSLLSGGVTSRTLMWNLPRNV